MQLARSQFLLADIVKQRRLDGVNIGSASAIEFIFDDVEQSPMQPLYQHHSFEVVWPHLFRALFSISSIAIGNNCFQHDASLWVFTRGPVPRCASTYERASKNRLNQHDENRIYPNT